MDRQREAAFTPNNILWPPTSRRFGATIYDDLGNQNESWGGIVSLPPDLWTAEIGRPQIYTPEAEARAEKMLLRYLSRRQAESYSSSGSFRVQGGCTGREYRIRKADCINVDDLGRRRRLCLVFPGVPLCDQLAGQKMLLEADETEFLKTAIDWGPLN